MGVGHEAQAQGAALGMSHHHRYCIPYMKHFLNFTIRIEQNNVQLNPIHNAQAASATNRALAANIGKHIGPFVPVDHPATFLTNFRIVCRQNLPLHISSQGIGVRLTSATGS